MPYDWKNQDTFGDKLSPGRHSVQVTKIIREKQDGSPFLDPDGNRKIGFAFTTPDGHEGADFFSTTGKFEWKLRKFIQAALSASELDDLMKSGIEPSDLLKPEVSEPLLIGRTLIAIGKQNGQYVNWSYERAMADAARF